MLGFLKRQKREPSSQKQCCSAQADNASVRRHSDSHQHDVDEMLECCRSIENAYWESSGQKMAPAPYYFERAAILSKKAHDFSGEVAICERWIALEDDYMAWRKSNPGEAGVILSASPRAKKIRARLPKARENLSKGK